MAKQTGLGWTTASVDDASGTPQAIKNDFNDLKISTPMAVIDVTGIDKFAYERLLGLADASITFDGTFNPAANMSHAVFSSVSSTRVNRTTTLVIGGATLACELLYTDYALTRATGGAFTFQAPGVLADGTAPTWS
jgi:hypothetical protein